MKRRANDQRTVLDGDALSKCTPGHVARRNFSNQFPLAEFSGKNIGGASANICPHGMLIGTNQHGFSAHRHRVAKLIEVRGIVALELRFLEPNAFFAGKDIGRA